MERHFLSGESSASENTAIFESLKMILKFYAQNKTYWIAVFFPDFFLISVASPAGYLILVASFIGKYYKQS